MEADAKIEKIPELGELSATLFQRTQDQICAALASIDETFSYKEDLWERSKDAMMPGGGGRTRVARATKVFEQAGVNFSEVWGTLPLDLTQKLLGALREIRTPEQFYATGLSLVFHPNSPMIPTTHANFRYLKVGEYSWFGGGMDLTPYYLFEEDAKHFHNVLKSACDRHDLEYYPSFKRWCDEYFFLPHRQETRGIGGIFFDYLGRVEPEKLASVYSFVAGLGAAFLEAYLPIVARRHLEPWGKAEKEFQLIRRGRYVEFNLLYDRGTQFGLSTGGRAESILMSLPPEVRWEYDFKPAPDSREARLIECLKAPREWV